MTLASQFTWILARPVRRVMLLELSQPLTATQCVSRTTLPLDTCKAILRQFVRRRLVVCLNESAQVNRLHFPTIAGQRIQRRVQAHVGISVARYELPDVDWVLYGRVCSRHRSAVILALAQPRTASQIRRKARDRDRSVRMNLNNVIDVLRELRAWDVVRPIETDPHGLRLYELTEAGWAFFGLLASAGMPV